MKQVIVVALTWCLMNNIASAKELLPWETENIVISISGAHSVRVDDRRVYFEIPSNLDFKAGQALVVLTRGDKYDDWLKRHGEYQKGCFGMSRDFYPLGIPLLGIDAQFSMLATVYIKTAPAVREHPVLFFDRGDFSKPEELEANLQRASEKYRRYITTPVDEVIINGRKWYRYLESPSSLGDPYDLREYFVTGLAPDRYLEVKIRMHPVPVSPDGYPRYVPEDQQPSWMKKAVKYKEQVINSIRITKQAGSNEPDLYEIEAAPPASEK